VSATESALLLVDDNEDNRYTLMRRLTREGYTNLTTATNGHEALDLLQVKPFELVLLDIMMPDMNGYEVLERMKASAELRNIPVIMISALSEIDSVIRCIELGAEDYLPKPFNPTLLRARIGASLEKKRLRDEVRASLARLEHEMDAARKLQLGMLPLVFPACTPEQPVEIYALMEPAREVGGDLYDFFYAWEHLFCFLVGDVSGKGAAAAMFMARTRSLVRMAVQLWRKTSGDHITPVRIIEAVNYELCQNNRDRMFVTLFLGVLDTKTGVLTYINAGHLAPCVLHASGSIEPVKDKPAMPLAVRAGATYQERTVTLLPDDTVFVFSDGVTEAMNAADELYGNARLHADLGATFAFRPEEIVRAIKAKVDLFTGDAPKFDDVTMLALRWRPAGVRLQTAKPNGIRHFAAEQPMILPQTTHIVIRNNMADLAALTTAMERVGAEHGMPEQPLFQLQVALDEIVSNVIKYAWPEAGAHDIEIRIRARDDAVEVEIIDDGRMFDPRDAPKRDEPLPGQRPQPGGLGVQMTKQLVDRMDYARIGNRNHTTLTKLCTLGAAVSRRNET
jgi:sigma-B regulation protein RsbU (phosphoserine phosphatase)